MTQELRKLVDRMEESDRLLLPKKDAQELLDRVEKAEKDAARYQWLRTQHDEEEVMTLWHVRGNYGEPIEAYKLDAELDIAMEASK